MATRKQLFIGLGGQGARTIRELRQQAYERELHAKIRNIPFDLNCAYLSIDSSPDIWESAGWSHMGKDLSLKENEKFYLEPSGISAAAPNISPWLYSSDPRTAGEQEGVLNDLLGKAIPGAQQRRRLGRALFAANAENIGNSIVNAYNQLRTTTANTDLECVISVFCSLGGGTGSGGVVDLISLLRSNFSANQAWNRCKAYPINLYLYITDPQTVDPSVVQGFFYENQYAALRDLNALCTGSLRLHALVNGKVQAGERQLVEDPLDAIILSTNCDSKSKSVGIERQIKRVATWALDRAMIKTDSTGKTAKIASGEDFKAETAGEPNNRVFCERSYSFANLGSGRWCTPINELLTMTADAILINSIRQMLYNDRSDDSGYHSKEDRVRTLSPAKLDSFCVADAKAMLITEQIREAWATWANNRPLVQELRAGDFSKKQPLEALEQEFQACFDEMPKELTLSTRKEIIKEEFSRRFNVDMMELPILLQNRLTSHICKEWKDGKIGLADVQPICEHVIKHTRKVYHELENYRKECQKAMDGAPATKYDNLCLDIAWRSLRGQNEWGKLTGVSRKFLGKQFVERHVADLVELYTCLCQIDQINDLLKQLDMFCKSVSDFVVRVENPINALVREEASLVSTYKEIKVLKYLQGDAPSQEDRLRYELNFGDKSVKDLVPYIWSECDTTKAINVIRNAETIRSIIAQSMQAASVDKLFGGVSALPQTVSGEILRTAYGLADQMLQQFDHTKGTSFTGGMPAQIRNMSAEVFLDRLKQLLSSAQFSYLENNNIPTSYYADIKNAYRTNYIVTFPAELQTQGINGMPKGKDELELALKTAIIGMTKASIENVAVSWSDDKSEIVVWQTQMNRPARNCSLIPFLKGEFEKKIASARGNAFLLHLEDGMEYARPALTFPTDTELQIMRDGAIWLIGHTEGIFGFDAEAKEYFLINDENHACIFRASAGRINALEYTNFFSSVQETLLGAVKDTPDLLDVLEKAVEEENKSRLNSGNRTALQTWQKMAAMFIRPTLYRISLNFDASR